MRLEKKTREEEGKVGVGGRAANLEWRWEEFISAPPFFPPHLFLTGTQVPAN